MSLREDNLFDYYEELRKDPRTDDERIWAAINELRQENISLLKRIENLEEARK